MKHDLKVVPLRTSEFFGQRFFPSHDAFNNFRVAKGSNPKTPHPRGREKPGLNHACNIFSMHFFPVIVIST